MPVIKYGLSNEEPIKCISKRSTSTPLARYQKSSYEKHFGKRPSYYDIVVTLGFKNLLLFTYKEFQSWIRKNEISTNRLTCRNLLDNPILNSIFFTELEFTLAIT